MISPAPIEVFKPQISPKLGEEGDCRFSGLRGVQWRINLGILPSSASIDELRRVTADARRRYAGFRRRLLVDPHFLKDGSSSPDLTMDNPLSQNPDSTWGQFFRNAELEKMVDQDLSRLYPEHGRYFQTPACQSILRRILLLWCLRHPEYGYRQGMHELLAPLLYVLHMDVQSLSEVQNVYEHHFNDKFDDMSFPESGMVCKYKSLKLGTQTDDSNSSQGSEGKASSIDELDPEIQFMVLLTDAYGAEGELGILISKRFMEHDAYSMFDALMGGCSGTVAMAEYFSSSPSIRSYTGVPPVIEASLALYHLLSIVDSSLHGHLVELGVEPQYFALRWLRVLFGREFILDDLLIIWDEIFASDNGKSSSSGEEEDSSFALLQSPRGAFISAMAVSMLLHLRSSLLATEHATSCLQRLLNFPEHIDVKKLIEKAKSLQFLALETNICCHVPVQSAAFDRSKSAAARGHSLSSGSISPRTPLNVIPESYWEEKWRVLHNEEAEQGRTGKLSSLKNKLSERIRLKLGRADSDPSHLKLKKANDSRLPIRRSLLEDLSRQLGLEERLDKEGAADADAVADADVDPFSRVVQVQETESFEGTGKQNSIKSDFGSVVREASLNGQIGSEENLFKYSASSSPRSIRANDHGNDSESSVVSNSSIDASCLKLKKANDSRLPVRRSLLEDLSRQLGLEESLDKEGAADADADADPFSRVVQVQETESFEGTGLQNSIKSDFGSVVREASLNGHIGSEENSFKYSASSSPRSNRANDHGNDSESSVVSNSSIDANCIESDNEGPCGQEHNDPPLPLSEPIGSISEMPEVNADATGKQGDGANDRKLLSGKFHWLWKFGKGGGEGTSEKGGHIEASRSLSTGNNQNDVSSTINGCRMSSGDPVDKNMLGTLKNLGHSMLENIQVIETVLPKDLNQVGSLENLSKNILVGKGQVKAVAALKELRKISNLLSEM